MKSPLFLALIMAFSSLTWAGKSGSGGGGNFCAVGGRLYLLDMVPALHLDIDDYTPGIQLSIPSPLRFGAVNPLTEQLKHRINFRMATFARNYPQLYNLMLLGLKENLFFATHEEYQGPIEATFENKTCFRTNTRAAIGYIGGIKIISLPTWNRLTLDMQAYTIIHEGLRLINEFRGFDIDNQQLQQLTRTIVLGGSLNENVTGLIDPYYNMLGISKDARARACALAPTGPTEKIRTFLQKICSNPFAFEKEISREGSLATDEVINAVERGASREVLKKDGAVHFILQLDLKMAIQGLNQSAANFALIGLSPDRANSILLSKEPLHKAQAQPINNALSTAFDQLVQKSLGYTN